VILGFLAVEGEGEVLAALRKGDGDRGDERDALVGRAEQHVELDAAGFGGFGVEFGEFAERVAIVEQAGVEEIGRKPPCLGLEFAKAQYLATDGEFDEILTKIHSSLIH